MNIRERIREKTVTREVVRKRADPCRNEMARDRQTDGTGMDYSYNETLI